MVGLGVLPGDSDSAATGVSGDGSVVVGYGRGLSGFRSFRWTSAGGLADLGYLPAGHSSWANAVSADGAVVVGASENPLAEPFRWTSAGGMAGLGVLPGDYMGWAYGASAYGAVVAGASYGSGGEEAFRWTSGGMVGLGFLPGASGSAAYAVSADGTALAGASGAGAAGEEAFRWTSSEGMVGLGGLPGASNSRAFAVSANGSVVVGWASGPGATRAFVWDAARGMRDLRSVLVGWYGLDLTGWQLGAAFGVSGDGSVIVGRGVGPSGRTEGWLATLDGSEPVPSQVPEAVPTLPLLAFAAGSLVLLRRRRRTPASLPSWSLVAAANGPCPIQPRCHSPPALWEGTNVP
jgi:probable HAF family extracellular repeat protein